MFTLSEFQTLLINVITMGVFLGFIIGFMISAFGRRR